MLIHLILPIHNSFPLLTTTCPHPQTMTSPKYLNTQTLCSHHKGILPLLLDISETLLISPTTPLPMHSKSDSDASLSTLQPSQHPNMPKKVLKFTDPNPLSQGIITAMEGRREQLEKARRR